MFATQQLSDHVYDVGLAVALGREGRREKEGGREGEEGRGIGGRGIGRAGGREGGEGRGGEKGRGGRGEGSKYIIIIIMSTCAMCSIFACSKGLSLISGLEYWTGMTFFL